MNTRNDLAGNRRGEAVRDIPNLYSAAYEAQYVTKDFRLAIELYRNLLRKKPVSREHGYSRSQIENIVSMLVPMDDLLDAQIQLALTYLD
jgi:hypothetical protein